MTIILMTPHFLLERRRVSVAVNVRKIGHHVATLCSHTYFPVFRSHGLRIKLLSRCLAFTVMEIVGYISAGPSYWAEALGMIVYGRTLTHCVKKTNHSIVSIRSGLFCRHSGFIFKSECWASFILGNLSIASVAKSSIAPQQTISIYTVLLTYLN